MRKTGSCLFVLFFVAAFELQAQGGSVKGRISNAGAPMDDAVVQLMRHDSTLARTAISENGGYYRFDALDTGRYFVHVSAPGYKVSTTQVFSLRGDTTIATVDLNASKHDLSEVTVTAKSPFIRREQGKVILDPANSIAMSGASAFEVVEKAPGVRVDNTDNITLNGKPGTMIWIDGKPSPLTGTELANFLRGIPSSAIERVEIISNPSASHDAAGSAVIDIRLRKDKRIGTNANLSLAYGQGVYPKSNNSLSFNHRDKKVNVFGSYSFAKRLAFSHLVLNRRFYKHGDFIGAYVQDNNSKFDFTTHVARAGVDYSIDKRNSISIVLSGVDNLLLPRTNNTSDVYDADNRYASVFSTRASNSSHWSNASGNLNYRHDFDSTCSVVTDVDVARYGNASRQNIETRYYDPSFNELRIPYLLHGDLDGQLNINAVKSDLSKSFADGTKGEAGIKSSYVIADNDLAFFDRSAGQNLADTSKSNHFIYRENINAAYVSLGKESGRWSYRLGIRVEHTLVRGLQVIHNARFDRNYAQLFPNLLVNRKLAEGHALEITYSRRIRRPNYEQLNPFKFYLDPTTYREGYPFLQPSITESFELTHIFREKIYTTLGFGRTFNNHIEVIAPLASEARVTVQTNRNLKMVDVYTFNSAIPVDVTTWWTTSTDFNFYYAFYTGDIADTQLNAIGGLNYNFGSTNTFRLPNDISIEVGGNYQSREIYAFDVINPIWYLNAGIQKKVLKNRGTIRINISDIFYTNRIQADVAYTDYKEHFLVERDTRVATASFTYRFGKTTVPPAKRRSGGAEDLKQRVGEGNG
jgi:hypothetical protein